MKYCCKVRHKGRLGLRKIQTGLGLATALFVITVMAFLAVIINQLVGSNAEALAEEVQLIQSFYAAESGIQFGLNEVFPPNPAASPTACAPSVSYPTFDFAAPGLGNCSANVSCDTLTVSSVPYYTITSTGTCGDVSRTIQVRAQ